MKRMVLCTRRDPEGLTVDGWVNRRLAMALCVLSDEVMTGEGGKDDSYRAIAIRRTQRTVERGSQIATGLYVERFGAEQSPEGFLNLSGRALLMFANRDGFGVALATEVVAEGLMVGLLYYQFLKLMIR